MAGEELARWLPAGGVEYLHFPELGGWRRARAGSPNGGWRIEAFQGYADYMASGDFAEGLARLEVLAAERSTTLMCAEAQWWRCHRRLLADALVVRGMAVRHIGSRGELAPHELTPFAVVEGERVTYPPAQATLELP